MASRLRLPSVVLVCVSVFQVTSSMEVPKTVDRMPEYTNATNEVSLDSDLNLGHYCLQVVPPLIIGQLSIVSVILWRKLMIAKRMLRELEAQNGNGQDSRDVSRVTRTKQVNAKRRERNGNPKPTTLIKLTELQIEFERELGFGAFGAVYLGELLPTSTPVAVKMSSKTTYNSEFKRFLDEINIMTFVGEHPNVVKLIGACTENISNYQVYIVMELCENGDLLSYLHKHICAFHNMVKDGVLTDDHEPVISYSDYVRPTHLSTLDLIRFTQDVLAGAEYLTSKNVLHGDLAARNLFLTKDLTVKIGDFGLARHLLSPYEYFTGCQKMPWRWVAPEVLSNFTYTTQPDIWAFGVTMWEIFTLGQQPYAERYFIESFFDEIKAGLRLQKPIYATTALYDIMTRCWLAEPSLRPTFKVLKKEFRALSEVQQLRKVNAAGYEGWDSDN